MNKVVIFDFDGTIANSFDSFLEIVHILSLKYKLPILTREELEALRSETASALIKRLHIPFYKLPFIARDMKQMQRQYIDQIKPFTGLPEVLHTLKELQFQLGIITSNGKENVELFIKQHAIEVFDFIYSDATIFGKDKVIRRFLSQQHIDKTEATYIGDEIRDIQACHRVGIPIISVTWGLNSKKGLLTYHPNFSVDTPKELLQLLKTKTP